MVDSFYEVMRHKGISRRNFMKFCSLTATSPGLAPSFVSQFARALKSRLRTLVLWLHGLACACCTESFIRSAHSLVKDVISLMMSIDYDDTLTAAAGHQAEAIIEDDHAQLSGGAHPGGRRQSVSPSQWHVMHQRWALVRPKSSLKTARR